MKRYIARYSLLFFLLFVAVLFQSCKTDEFHFDEITLKDDFGIKIITPLYSGKDKNGNILEFRDFIHDWNKPFTFDSVQNTVLQFANGSNVTIPTNLIFDPSVVIDSLAFLIQGSYRLTDIELVFTVTNSCPLPLNLQLQFLVQNSLNNGAAPISPPPFSEADFSQLPWVPTTSIYTVKLDSLQTLSFTDSRRIKLTSWFDETNFINQNDTLSAHYPIDLSIVLIGFVEAE